MRRESRIITVLQKQNKNMSSTRLKLFSQLALAAAIFAGAQSFAADETNAVPVSRDSAPSFSMTPDTDAPTPELSAWQEEFGATHDQRMQWWRAARFGMFIHWGVYSVP